jgi:hypothetical protein
MLVLCYTDTHIHTHTHTHNTHTHTHTHTHTQSTLEERLRKEFDATLVPFLALYFSP